MGKKEEKKNTLILIYLNSLTSPKAKILDSNLWHKEYANITLIWKWVLLIKKFKTGSKQSEEFRQK